MVSAIFMAIFWFSISLSEPWDAQISLLPLPISYLLAGLLPFWLRQRHIRSQNRLLDRCRALLMAGAQALERGDRDGAVHLLARIHRIESLWRLGNSRVLRVSLALWAIGMAAALCVLARYLGLTLRHHYWGGRSLTHVELLTNLKVAVAISIVAPLESALSFFMEWQRPWTIDNCGDRLSQLLYGSPEVATNRAGADETPCFDGLSPREIFSLGPTFTKRELDKARRRLIWELHPDRQQRISQRERVAREEVLKRVNAAYDALKPEVAK